MERQILSPATMPPSANTQTASRITWPTMILSSHHSVSPGREPSSATSHVQQPETSGQSSPIKLNQARNFFSVGTHNPHAVNPSFRLITNYQSLITDSGKCC